MGTLNWQTLTCVYLPLQDFGVCVLQVCFSVCVRVRVNEGRPPSSAATKHVRVLNYLC